ncbi:MAG: hypothetical protein NWR21_09840 [Verrucomicrobiales bacterium]|nr:hypothetical protein [Verrucomicrobiales bacterium]
MFQHREDDPAERGENGREDEAPDDAAAAGEEATQLSSQIEIAQRFGGGFLDFFLDAAVGGAPVGAAVFTDAEL